MNPRLFCQVLAPAFVHLLDEPADDVDPVQEATRQLEAATLGLMRETLTWPGAASVSKGMVTKKLNAADQGHVALHAGWSKAQGHSNAARSEWWLLHVAGALSRMGLGRVALAADGSRYFKPTMDELQSRELHSLLAQRFQLSPEAVLRTVAGTKSAERSQRQAANRSSASAALAPAPPSAQTEPALSPLLPTLPDSVLTTVASGEGVAFPVATFPADPSASPASTLPAGPASLAAAGLLATSAPSLRVDSSPATIASTPRAAAMPAASMRLPAAPSLLSDETSFDPYEDPMVADSLRLQGGADQLALNNLHIFFMVATRARTPRQLHAYMLLDQRLEQEESDILSRLRELLDGGNFDDQVPRQFVFFSDELSFQTATGLQVVVHTNTHIPLQTQACSMQRVFRSLSFLQSQALAQLPVASGLAAEMCQIWLQWLDLAYVRSGRIPPQRALPTATPERPAQRRRLAAGVELPHGMI